MERRARRAMMPIKRMFTYMIQDIFEATPLHE